MPDGVLASEVPACEVPGCKAPAVVLMAPFTSASTQRCREHAHCCAGCGLPIPSHFLEVLDAA